MITYWLINLTSLTFASHARWGQVFILDALSRYKAANAREAENIVERVTPRLQHVNCAVVFLHLIKEANLILKGHHSCTKITITALFNSTPRCGKKGLTIRDMGTLNMSRRPSLSICLNLESQIPPCSQWNHPIHCFSHTTSTIILLSSNNLYSLLASRETASWWTIVKGKYSTMVLKRSGSNSICSYSETKNSPFYGQRRPMLQRGAKLLCVSDLLLLGRATIKELRSLLH
ncbi:hypothetical protein JHK82_027427 [Glycine max]|nr:hypothetical protein JHK82_027427 [Glycine max]